jgi:tetratricopeptide (TPR) repeat protein
MIAEWRRMAHEESGSPLLLQAWCETQTAWYGQEVEYSVLFAQLYPDMASRQAYIERKIDGRRPAWGYLYLANLMSHGWFRIALTTNFDNLLAEALSLYTGTVPVVCAADSEVLALSLNSRRPQVFKLHGDYLYLSQKHTVDELQHLGQHMDERFRSVLREHGLLVLGYGGRDRSIMQPLRAALAVDAKLGPSVYWGLWRDELPSSMVAALAADFPERFHLFRFDDFDAFAGRLHARCGKTAELPLPATVLDPYGSLKGMLHGLVEAPRTEAAAQVVHADLELLRGELDRTELLLANTALAQRRPGDAMAVADGYVQRHPQDSLGRHTLASALGQRAEDTGSDADMQRALDEMRQAVQLDPRNVAALYSLAMLYARLQRDDDTLATLQALLPHSPRDKGLRANLAALYLKKGRSAEAAQELRQCLQTHGDDAQLHAMWAGLMVQNGHTTAALKAIDEAIRLAPDVAGLHAYRAQVLATLMRPSEALRAFERALKLDPGNTFVRLACARVHMAVYDGPRALEQTSRALRDNPDSVEALGLLAQMLGQVGRTQEALEQFNRLVRLTPEDARAWASRGQLLASMRQWPQAEKDLLEAVRLTPQEVSFRAMLAMYYHEVGRFDRVQAVMSEIQRLAPAVAQTLGMQLQMRQPMRGGTGGIMPPGPPGTQTLGQGLLQRFLDSLR